MFLNSLTIQFRGSLLNRPFHRTQGAHKNLFFSLLRTTTNFDHKDVQKKPEISTEL